MFRNCITLNQHPQNIVIRMPNWLGDMVMAAPAVQLLRQRFPQSKFTLICKKGLEGVLKTFEGEFEIIIFNKSEFKGLAGIWRFGKQLSLSKEDCFVCFPNSISSALMAYASGAGNRIGYANEFRGLLLTDKPKWDKGLHRVEQYFQLVKSAFNFMDATFEEVRLQSKESWKVFDATDTLLVSFNSEAKSRRMPIGKAISILNTIKDLPFKKIILIGGPKDIAFNEFIIRGTNESHIISIAGQTNLAQLAALMSNAKALLTVDSGPSHLANALRLQTVVMHGADDENNTEAYNKAYVHGLRYGKLPCEPCVKNICKLGDESPCLLNLDELLIKEKLSQILPT